MIFPTLLSIVTVDSSLTMLRRNMTAKRGWSDLEHGIAGACHQNQQSSFVLTVHLRLIKVFLLKHYKATHTMTDRRVVG